MTPILRLRFTDDCGQLNSMTAIYWSVAGAAVALSVLLSGLPILFGRLSAIREDILADIRDLRAIEDTTWQKLMEKSRTGRSQRAIERREFDGICSCDIDNRCPMGPKGRRGEKGLDGLNGRPGPQGMRGLPGNYPPVTVEIMFVDSGEAYSPRRQVLCRSCPRGKPGKKQVNEDTTNYLIGEMGPRGERGLPGNQGLHGINGAMGKRGLVGLRGIPGRRGAPGARGNVGPKGSSGRNGYVGQKGAKGMKGARGPAGVKGQKAEQGSPGALGINGLRGRQGPVGNRGRKGAVGIVGLSGRRGIPGRDGAYCPCPKRELRQLN
ncbi:hypothetical protein M3Y95_01007000 [Aphelenchoides besseyi]|nr:hypothetical protein M3Y95_01007000 [Aphelenchoides besseyi]